MFCIFAELSSGQQKVSSVRGEGDLTGWRLIRGALSILLYEDTMSGHGLQER